MSEPLKHECGIAFIRLLKPLEYYQEKYGSWRYGLQKVYLLMEKQHNRGQDGAGVASLKLDPRPGTFYINRQRSNKPEPIRKVFGLINKDMKEAAGSVSDWHKKPSFAKQHLPFAAELYLGHVRYGTFGLNTIETVHPFIRANNWKTRSLVVAGNFNLTNVDELFQKLLDLGQHPREFADTVTILEKLGHFLDAENQVLFNRFKAEGHPNKMISEYIAQELDVAKVLRDASKDFDGGYVIEGMMGHGDSFVMRDPWGIRPAFYYHDEEVVVVASERPVIQTVMNVPVEKVQELEPGEAIIVKASGRVSVESIRAPKERKACSFERIYFSRGTDQDIYQERLKLGQLVTPQVLQAVDYDLENSVFSFIPTTAEIAFYGMVRAMESYMIEEKKRIIGSRACEMTQAELEELLSRRPRVEKIAVKDVKLRTFISQDEGREDLVGHVYDVTYGTVRAGVDNLVVIDDSIVRGTTLRESILRILDRLGPRRIVVVSSAPQIRYPDCYGIDMSRLTQFVAFHAAIKLLEDRGMESVKDIVLNRCLENLKKPLGQMDNPVKMIYEPFSYQEVSDQIAKLLTPDGLNAEVKIVYQSIENLHLACPKHLGDWYFTGDFPTPGGMRVVNQAFVNYCKKDLDRSYAKNPYLS